MAGKIYKNYTLGNPSYSKPGFAYWDSSYQYRGLVPAPLISLRAHGKINNTVFQKHYYGFTIQYPRRDDYQRGENRPNKPTSTQQYYFDKFKNGVAMWKASTPQQKAYYEQRAKKSGKPWWGMSWYLHRYMLDLPIE